MIHTATLRTKKLLSDDDAYLAYGIWARQKSFWVIELQNAAQSTRPTAYAQPSLSML